MRLSARSRTILKHLLLKLRQKSKCSSGSLLYHYSPDRLVRSNSPISHRKVFTWENLNYHVPVPGGTRRLLHDVYGYVKPGTLTALMGASGAGVLFLWSFVV